jgi:hypothetical protein
MLKTEGSNYFFKCENIKISFFNVESEDIAWLRLGEQLQKDEDHYDREMPDIKKFQLVAR